MPVSKPTLTFNGFLQKPVLNKNQGDERDVDNVLQRFKVSSFHDPYNPPFYFALQFGECNYLLITENSKTILGYPAQEFMEGGLQMSLDIYNKEDYRIYNEEIFPSVTTVLKDIPVDLHKQLVFSRTHRIKHKNKKWVFVYEQHSFITDPVTGLPTHGMGTVTDISLIKQDTVLAHNIQLYDDINGYQLIQQGYAYPNAEDSLFSRREMEVLKWMAEGLASKEIADKMFISISTVVNHRKNMLKKSNCKNVAEMIAQAIKKRIL